MMVVGKKAKFHKEWEAERQALKDVDWFLSPLFAAYSDYVDSHSPEPFSAKLSAVTRGQIYSDVELQYIIRLIRNL